MRIALTIILLLHNVGSKKNKGKRPPKSNSRAIAIQKKKIKVDNKAKLIN